MVRTAPCLATHMLNCKKQVVSMIIAESNLCMSIFWCEYSVHPLHFSSLVLTAAAFVLCDLSTGISEMSGDALAIDGQAMGLKNIYIIYMHMLNSIITMQIWFQTRDGFTCAQEKPSRLSVLRSSGPYLLLDDVIRTWITDDPNFIPTIRDREDIWLPIVPSFNFKHIYIYMYIYYLRNNCVRTSLSSILVVKGHVLLKRWGCYFVTCNS